MNEFTALVTVIAIALILSTVTVVAIHAPLQRLLEAICPLGSTAVFWTRAAVILIYLMPLWVAVAFGLPQMQQLAYLSAGEVIRRAFSATSFALVVIVVATGLRLSSLRPPSNYDLPPPVR
jgi:hypothetical protein